MKNTTLWKDASSSFKVVSCLAAILLFACSSGFPSESAGKRFLENYKKFGRLKEYNVRSFTKTNGVETGNTYSLEFEAEVECLYEVTPQPGDIPILEKFDVLCEKVGALKKLKGKILFEK